MAWVGAHFGWVMSTQGTSVFRQGHTAMTIIDKSVRNDDFRAFKIFLNFLNCGTEIKIRKIMSVPKHLNLIHRQVSETLLINSFEENILPSYRSNSCEYTGRVVL